MKLKVAGITILSVVLLAFLVSCGGSKAVKTTQTAPPAPAATTGSKAMSAGSEKKMPPAGAMSTANDSGQVAMVMLKDIHFDFDRYDIRPPDAEVLKKDYAWFNENPKKRVEIEGNCDERGSIEYNLALGQRRADATKDFLTTLGVSAGELRTISYGKEKPVDPGHNEEAWAKNRRAHLEAEK